MYCKNCGNYNDDNASFCLTCGAALQQPQPQQEEGYQPAEYPQQYDEPKKKLQISKPLLFGIIGGVAAVALAIILLTTLLGGQHTWKGALNSAFNAVKNFDAEKTVDLAYPGKVLKALKEDDTSKSDLKKQIASSYKSMKNYMDSDYKKAWKSMSYKIVEVEDMDEDEIEDINDAYSRRYDTPDNYVKAGKVVTIEVKLKIDGEYETTETEITMIKCEGKWYVYDGFDMF